MASSTYVVFSWISIKESSKGTHEEDDIARELVAKRARLQKMEIKNIALQMPGPRLEGRLLEMPQLNISFTPIELMRINKNTMCSSKASGKALHPRILTYLDYNKGTFDMTIH